MIDVDEVLEKRRLAKARYDKSDLGKAAKARAWQKRKAKLAERRAVSAAGPPKKEAMEGVWYEDDPRLVRRDAPLRGGWFSPISGSKFSRPVHKIGRS